MKKIISLSMILLFVAFSLVLVNGSVFAQENPRILVSPKGTDSPYWLVVKAGAEAAAEEFGAEIVWQGPQKETNVAKQVNIIDNYITQQVDAMVIAATDANALVPPLKRAKDNGIPVITIDSGVTDESVVDSHIATNNFEAAKKAADVLAELIGEEGQVASIPFVAGAATSMQREDGFKAGVDEYSNIELVATQYSQADIAKAMQVTENILTANPELEGIFAANLPGGIGAARAIKSRGSDVKLVSFDAGDTQIQLLKEGSIDALIVQQPFQMGYQGVKYALQAINGEEIPEAVDTGAVVATKDNMDDHEVHKVLFPNE